MTIPEMAVEWALKIADDNSHGYDQTGRWGPDYDCSSLVISAYKHAGVPLTCTYTGNMRSDMLNHGFAPVPTANLKTGAGLKPGDVLLNEAKHTAMYIGDGKVVHAAGNEYGKATGGKTGDQTGEEIGVTAYFNFPWDTVLRYCRKDEAQEETGETDTYTVQAGDSLWSIAEKCLGDGFRYGEIKALNNLKSYIQNGVEYVEIHPGMVLKIPGTKFKTIEITISKDTFELLSIMAKGWGKTIGECIDALMEDAV